MFFIEVIWVGEEGNAERCGSVGMVRVRVSENGMALGEKGFG